MSLWTSPVTFTVNTLARIFSFRAQLPSDNSVVGEWIEPAGNLAYSPKIVVKHDSSNKKVKRSLLQYTVKQPVVDLSLKPLTVNFTIIADKEHTASQIDEALELMAVAVTSQSFRDAFIRGEI